MPSSTHGTPVKGDADHTPKLTTKLFDAPRASTGPNLPAVIFASPLRVSPAKTRDEDTREIFDEPDSPLVRFFVQIQIHVLLLYVF